MNDVTIVDAICGKGKTSYAIQMMNNNQNDKFIYITPFLDEVKRVIDNCPNRYFEQPDEKKGKGSKLTDFNYMIADGKNICSTHALFRYANQETFDNLLMDGDYVLILDEVVDVVEEMNITKSDKEVLLNGKVEIAEDGKVTWIDKEYNGKLNEYKKLIENGDVYLIHGTFLLWTFPAEIMKLFKHTYVLTYMFKGQTQRYYYDLNNITYEYKSVIKIDDKYQLTDYQEHEDLSYLKELINICEDDKLNGIGTPKDKRSNPLSKSWYDNQYVKKLDGMKVLKNNTANFFKHICKSKSDDNMWTTFKDYKTKCQGGGYTKGFVACNARATNNYKHKKNLAYLINSFNNPRVLQFFIQRGIEIDEETYALSELIQWMFRSQLRENKPINIYIPSERMRNLLKNWLNES